MQCRTVNRDGTYATVVGDRFGGGGQHVVGRRCGMSAQRRGEGIGAQVDRKPCPAFLIQICHQRQHRVGGGGEVGPRLEDYRNQLEKHALEKPVQFGCTHAVGPDTQDQGARALGERGQHRTVSVSHRNLPGRRERLGDLPAGLDVAQPVGAADERPPAGQRRLGLGVEDGVQRPDRKAFIGRRVEELLGCLAQFGGILAAALGQHAGNGGAPLLAIRLRSHGRIYRHRLSPVVAVCDLCV